jgi:hypothetical protein
VTIPVGQTWYEAPTAHNTLILEQGLPGISQPLLVLVLPGWISHSPTWPVLLLSGADQDQ